ncbi:aminoglycoside phosphotransferase family protein [Streptomyces sp. J2-1]|uniref:phosphotransferase enzyme family protein n=1 Tax=Streptomyces corallincola TaxID=2851888 RepID=UPI001C38AF08|nr:aminoglycoside phosphotransferase family protein [Streptomyces corallincola]MBV2354033.1 aminoglycoside phosphotransferase family protein [Streptomyces corallincola]
MRGPESPRARDAAIAAARTLGLAVEDAVVLHDSNRLTLRLSPCDVVARVEPGGGSTAAFEVGLGRKLADAGCPVGEPAPRAGERVHERDGFAVTFWTYYEPTGPPEIPPAAYARALRRLHAGMRTLDAPVPRFTERAERAERLVADPERTPGLTGADRELLGRTLRTLKVSIGAHRCGEQPLHGEPHPGNVLATARGPLFIDLETCCRGPVEFDLAHAPEEVAAHVPEADQALLDQCRLLVLAMITAWRWDREDRFPDGHRLGVEWLARIRDAAGSR